MIILFMFLILFLAGVLCLLFVLITGIKKYKEYKESEYYKSTKFPYWRMYFDKGRFGEYDTYRCLCPLEGYKKYLFNCYIPKADGTTTEADIIMIHESGIYVFESKEYSGWIFGTETQWEWTQALPTGRGKSQKEHFFNPIIQNKVHLKWLQLYLKDWNNVKFYSYIVFGMQCELKNITLTSGEHHVVKREELLEAVLQNAYASAEMMPKSLIDEIYEKLYPLTQVGEIQKNKHIENIRKRYEKPVSSTKLPETQDKICPRCGGKLVLKVAKRGNYAGNKFYGCKNYPECKYIENIM